MRHPRGLAIRCFALLGSVSFLGCPSDSAVVSEQVVAANDCPAPSTWFPHDQTPLAVADTFTSDSQCRFHQWSWQSFLWLTQDEPATGGPRFLSFTTQGELLTGAANSAFMVRTGKRQDPESVDEILQAGTDGIMTDQAGRPIYYSLYVDPTFEAFVRERDLTNPASLAALGDTVTFPNGAMELKASWKVVAPGEDTGRFFTMTADVQTLTTEGGNSILINRDETQSVTLALVGFHIAGRVQGHPEMIWATFEHVDNAPDVFTYENISSPIGVEAPVSDRDFTFYAADIQRDGCNVNYANSPIRRLDVATQTISPITQVCRQYEFGNRPVALHAGSSPIDSAVVQSDGNVASLNGHVLGNLAADDVWRNYREVGAVWFNELDALRPNLALGGLCVDGRQTEDGCVVDGSSDPGARLIGSLLLSNSTIETFTQEQSAMDSCFRCHNTSQRFPPDGSTTLAGKNVNISHIIVNAFFRNQAR